MDAETTQRFARLIAARTADVSAQIERSTARISEVTRARADTAEDDEHDPEGSTASQDRAMEVHLRDVARGHLADLDIAAQRLAAGAFDVCERCGGPIALARLQARPETRLCIKCASAPR